MSRARRSSTAVARARRDASHRQRAGYAHDARAGRDELQPWERDPSLLPKRPPGGRA